jgi:DNA-binding transcriptional LysR family regulator
MRVESLELFLSVVETGSISHAARQAYISQQGASSIVKNLEQEYGVTLFERRGNFLQLTEAGYQFAKQAKEVIFAHRRLQTVAALDGKMIESESPLRIIATPFTLNALSPIFDAYCGTDQLQETLAFTERSLFNIIDERSRLDSNALYIINIPSFMSGIYRKTAEAFEPLVVTELMLCCSAECALGEKSIVKPENLRDTRIACYSEELLIRLIHHLLKDVDGAQIYYQTTNLQLLYRAIQHQHMVGFTDSLSLFLRRHDNSHNTISVIPFEQPLYIVTGILGNPESEHARHFVTFLKRFISISLAAYLKHYDTEGLIRYIKSCNEEDDERYAIARATEHLPPSS